MLSNRLGRLFEVQCQDIVFGKPILKTQTGSYATTEFYASVYLKPDSAPKSLSMGKVNFHNLLASGV